MDLAGVSLVTLANVRGCEIDHKKISSPGMRLRKSPLQISNFDSLYSKIGVPLLTFSMGPIFLDHPFCKKS